MKKTVLISILLLVMNSASAEDICGAPCQIFITFPTGGSITASEGMVLTFGENGILDLGETGTVNTAIQPESLDFSLGGSLTLAPGESISFANNGLLDLGSKGNISAINYNISTSGNITILSLESGVDINGGLEATGSLLIDARTVHIEDKSLIISDNIMTTGIDTSTLGPVNIATDFSILGDGFVFPVDNTTDCTVSGSQCITDTGTVYILNDKGEIVELNEEGSGSIDIISLLFILMSSVYIMYRRQSIT